MNRLLSLFDVLWKICLLLVLLWIGQSLREIADASYGEDGPVDSAESMRLDSPGQANPIRPGKAPAQDMPTAQIRL